MKTRKGYTTHPHRGIDLEKEKKMREPEASSGYDDEYSYSYYGHKIEGENDVYIVGSRFFENCEEAFRYIEELVGPEFIKNWMMGEEV